MEKNNCFEYFELSIPNKLVWHCTSKLEGLQNQCFHMEHWSVAWLTSIAWSYWQLATNTQVALINRAIPTHMAWLTSGSQCQCSQKHQFPTVSLLHRANSLTVLLPSDAAKSSKMTTLILFKKQDVTLTYPTHYSVSNCKENW